MKTSTPPFIVAVAALFAASSAAPAADLKPIPQPNTFEPAPPVKALPPAETIKATQLPPGYRLETVLSEPDIKEPVAIAFDGDGRIFVAEMRTYMQDVDATGEHDPVSRVSLHWSSKGDGVYDKHTVFADKLLLPRILLPLDKGRVLIGETDTNDLYIYSDTDGDGVSDKKDLFYQGGPRGGNMEHQPSGPVWALDNWLYTTYNAYRLRWSPDGQTQKEATAPNGGQWGVSQDDWGKTWFVNAGGEKGPTNFQTGIVYGGFNTKDQFTPGYDEVWPIVGLGDVQGGERRYRPEDGTVNHFTATCGGEIYRGDKLPELRGDLFFGEPVGRLARRTKIEVKDGITILSNPHEKSEFIRSTDPLFRPVNFNTAPDGTLFITDMYRGIIQEGNWTKEGSYLRKAVLQHGLDKPVSMGRVYRLVHESARPGELPKMSSETPAQLVAHLAHPNGWWRDTAQKLLVLKQDASVVPALNIMARNHKDPLARLHALWTLEGLDAVTPELLRAKLKDQHPQLRAAALRVSETLYKKGDTSLAADIQGALKDPDGDVVLQALLTAKLLNLPDWKTTIEGVVKVSTYRGVKEIGDMILNPPKVAAPVAMSDAEKKLFKDGETAFQTLCSACHGMDGKGMAMAGAPPGSMLAPALAGSKTVLGWREGAIHVLLQGLTGDIDGKKYEGQMIPMATNDDAWIAGVLSYVRNSFGNRAGFVKPEDVARLRAASKDRAQPWTIDELRSTLPQPLANRKDWKLTASDNPNDLAQAIDGKGDTRYTTKTFQKPGQWLQIELPQETLLVGVQLDSAKSANDYPRGYKVELSADGQAWKQAAAGKGAGAVTDIQFPVTKAKFIRITQTGSVGGLFWSIHELQVFAAASRGSRRLWTAVVPPQLLRPCAAKAVQEAQHSKAFGFNRSRPRRSRDRS
jgi:mono/diheme cytochrome c family protein/glucose/arabinose dehydrogenase